MKGYQVKRAVTGKINNATYKAKKIASKYANKALSSIKSTASAYKNKVTNFLNKFMGRKSTTITLESKPIQRSNSLVGKPIETTKASGTQRRRPDNKMEQIARKVEREKSDSNWVSKPVNRKISISSKRSPYYKS